MKHHDQSPTPVVAPLPSSVTRRGFLGSALATSAFGGLLASRGTAADEAPAPAAAPTRVIKLGLIGCGGRGAWLGGMFKKHGGFEIHATADYDEAQANAAGDALGVDKARRFSGLSAYQKLIASGCEAVTVVNIPRFHATHGPAAIEAGLHVYAAKPVAIDVPGALAVQAAGKLATGKKLVYLVTYEFDDGLLWTHRCQALDNAEDSHIRTRIFGDTAHADINYSGRAFLRGGKQQYGGGAIEGSYNRGTERNIAAFHQAVCAGDCGNPTVARATDDILTAVLGREAATRGTPLAMDDLIRENQAIPFDLTGAKA